MICITVWLRQTPTRGYEQRGGVADNRCKQWLSREISLPCFCLISFPFYTPEKTMFALHCCGLNRLSTLRTFIIILTCICPCQFSVNLPSLQLAIWLSNASCWSIILGTRTACMKCQFHENFVLWRTFFLVMKHVNQTEN